MTINLLAYLDTAPSLEEMRETLGLLGILYRHTLPADDRWNYPMHVFGRVNLRVVYHAGNPKAGESLVDSCSNGDLRDAEVQMRMVLGAVVRRFGGEIYDSRDLQRGAVM